MSAGLQAFWASWRENWKDKIFERKVFKTCQNFLSEGESTLLNLHNYYFCKMFHNLPESFTQPIFGQFLVPWSVWRWLKFSYWKYFAVPTGIMKMIWVPSGRSRTAVAGTAKSLELFILFSAVTSANTDQLRVAFRNQSAI